MAKNHVLPRYLLWIALCVCGVLGSDFLEGKQRIGGEANSSSQNAESKRLEEIYTAELGVKEATGNNDGRRVGEYLRYCGLGEGYAWCAAFVSWCHGQAGYPGPRNAWSPALFPASRTIWKVGDLLPANGGRQPIPRPGDVFGIYYINLQRIAHAGFVDGWDGKYCTTVEGNTGPDGAIGGGRHPTLEISDPANPIRAGPPREGVYKKRRPVRTIRAVARWAD